VNAHRINQRYHTRSAQTEAESDFYFVEATIPRPHCLASSSCELTASRAASVSIHPRCHCSPDDRGGVGARPSTSNSQAALNPAGDRKVERFGWTFGARRQVMQIENDYDKEVYNGEHWPT